MQVANLPIFGWLIRTSYQVSLPHSPYSQGTISQRKKCPGFSSKCSSGKSSEKLPFFRHTDIGQRASSLGLVRVIVQYKFDFNVTLIRSCRMLRKKCKQWRENVFCDG